MTYLVGLTGGIGCGKSTVAALFASHGVRVVDTDVISHRLTQAEGEAIPAIRQTFGPAFLDRNGALDRARMRKLIYHHHHEKLRLEAILHPLILTQAQREALSPTNAPYTLVVVPLLFESGRYADWLNHVIAVDCPQELQIKRTMQRSGLDQAAVHAIMAQQLGRNERVNRADEVIRNDSDLDALRIQVDAIHRHLCALAAKTD